MSRRIEDLEQETQKRCLALVGQALAIGIELIVVHTLRTWEEQALIWAKGRSRPGPIVTNARPGSSWHNYGRAFDVAFKHDHQIRWVGPWEQVGLIGEAVGLEWGGRNKTLVDKPHFQYRNNLTLTQARVNFQIARDNELSEA